MLVKIAKQHYKLLHKGSYSGYGFSEPQASWVAPFAL